MTEASTLYFRYGRMDEVKEIVGLTLRKIAFVQLFFFTLSRNDSSIT